MIEIVTNYFVFGALFAIYLHFKKANFQAVEDSRMWPLTLIPKNVFIWFMVIAVWPYVLLASEWNRK